MLTADDCRREAALVESIGRLESCIVAFSGGVDSTYLAWSARQALGPMAQAVTAFSPSFPHAQREEVCALASRIGIAHSVIETDETADPRYRVNDVDRCYWCKSELYGRLNEISRRYPSLRVLDGTNHDDLSDIRPGRRAARELGVSSPLAEAGLGKAAIRRLSRRAGLPTWHRPASPCLASRVPFGSSIDDAMLHQIDRAEDALRRLGLREFRVRHLGTRARIEISASELGSALVESMAARIVAAVRDTGFGDAEIDRDPFQSGRLHRDRSATSPVGASTS